MPYDRSKGARADEGGLAPDFLLKSGFYNYKLGFITNFWFLIVIKPFLMYFWELLGSFGA